MRIRSLVGAAVFFSLSLSVALGQEPLTGTKPLKLDKPLDEVMVDGLDQFCLKELAASAAKRAKLWTRDFTSPEAYEKSVAPNRDHLRTIIGAVDPRVEPLGLELIATTTQPAIVAKTEAFTVYSVRWPVLAGVTAEGLLLQPSGTPIARVVALPDADWTPEIVSGIGKELNPASQLARRLAESGCQVLVPTIISREDTHSGNPAIRMTNQTHREWVYRSAFEMGRHVIGYEVQKVQAAVDQFTRLNTVEKASPPIGVVGVGEGGLIALYSAAVDPRIQSAFVSGYYAPRDNVWQEPIYRNVWALLHEFGDAEIASLIAPRALSIEAASAPESAGPPAVKEGRSGGAAPGVIKTPATADVTAEFERAKAFYARLGVGKNLSLATFEGHPGPAGSSAEGLNSFLRGLGLKATAKAAGESPLVDAREKFSASERQGRQVAELIDFTQHLLKHSATARDKLWIKADRSNVAAWVKTAESYRDLVYDELIGRLPAPTMDPNVRTRKLQELDTPEFSAYEVVIDVYPEVIAGGILLLPKDLQPGDKRPVVVCQHGLEGVPVDTISKTVPGYAYYKAFAAELAKRGFITYAPQNPYRGKDRFRTLQRKSNPLKRSLFSYIIPQHQRTIDFLKTLPNVDPQRIGFYGLSYGGKTAVRVPPMLTDYALSICSADYNEWVSKNASTDVKFSYVFTGEYEIFEWNMGHVANYAELSYLMTPRPFMVERGHTDGVSEDEWVAWEFAKVLRHYDFVGLPGMTEMEVFNGPHTINGMKTYDFLHRHLKWPKK